MTRPKRLHIPIGTKREVAARQGGLCACGCKLVFADWSATHGWQVRRQSGIQFDHHPALRLRAINRTGTDYVPRQLSPFYIVARCKASHDRKTRGQGATIAGSDLGAIVKERKRARDHSHPKPQKRVGWHQTPGSQGLASTGLKNAPKRKTQKLQGRQFPKIHRPMRRAKP